ncbi:MAG: hypothetical protein OEZ39_04785 [Gammaproteobacteria bacterium]|nr:hypothetical protein [Gammaproteobacteria bacterium]MDH5651174.1 hypothetical protein [Gammaproteobacteria bacterium]
MTIKTLPCVGFELHYSPFEKDCVENLAHKFVASPVRLAFDVQYKIDLHQQLVILFSNQYGPTERLYGKIRGCLQVGADTYRVKVELQTKPDISLQDVHDIICLPVMKGIATPVEITLQCPSCKELTHFNLIADQKGDWEKGIMPLYNCGSCGTTRAIIGLLEHNHSSTKNRKLTCL